MHLATRRRIIRLSFEAMESVCYVAACAAGLAWAGGSESALLRLDLLSGAVLALGFFVAIGPTLRIPEGPRVARKRSILLEHSRQTVIAAATVALGALLVGSETLLSRVFLAGFAVSLFALRTLTRLGARLALQRLRRHSRNLRNVLIVGSGERAAKVVEEIRRNAAYGYKIVGYVDDEFPGAVLDVPMLGQLKHIAEVLDRTQIDEVFTALPVRSCYDTMRSVTAECEERGIAVHLAADFFGLDIAHGRASQLGALPIYSLVSSGPMGGVPYLVKRTIDRVGAFVLLVVLSPLLLAAAAAIAVSMGRPILFVQPRVGLHRRQFRCYKFRTMRPDAEALMPDLQSLNEMDGAVFKIQNDPRVTPLGRLLRRFSIDELPQLLNVLKGEMSLVGPRPLPLRDVERFDRAALHRRCSVWPGLTCIWQVSGRNETDFEDWMSLDFEYVDRWSLGLDFKILLQTITAVLGGRGAY